MLFTAAITKVRFLQTNLFLFLPLTQTPLLDFSRDVLHQPTLYVCKKSKYCLMCCALNQST